MSFSRRHFFMLAVAGVAAVPLTTVLASRASAQTAQVYAEDGIAIDGTDPVAYFTQGAPVAGSPEHAFDWQGATWQFSSAENRDAFAADPEAYAPQYGGYCAYAVADGSLVSTTPEAWEIVDGKLYLNYSRRIARKWQKDQAEYIAAADRIWPGLVAE